MSDLFEGATPQVAIKRQIECVDRELKFRRFVYPRRIEAAKMTQKKADDEIAMMEAVRSTLAKHSQLSEFVGMIARLTTVEESMTADPTDALVAFDKLIVMARQLGSSP